MTYEFSIEEKLFKTDTLFIIGCGWAEFRKRVAQYGLTPPAIDNYVIGTVIEGDNVFWRIVWVKDFKPRSPTALVHELFHLTTAICQDRGVPIVVHHPSGNCGDETSAYLLEFYLKECLKEINKQNGKRRKKIEDKAKKEAGSSKKKDHN